MRALRRWVPELGYLGIVALWALTTGMNGDAPAPAASLGGVGVTLGGIALLIRAVTPLLRPSASHGPDRDDIRWQEQTTAAIDQLGKTMDAWLVEQRRHNRAVEGYMQDQAQAKRRDS